jgi:tau tubulin kinase
MEACRRFEVHQQLGEGSFSRIFQALDKKLKHLVALKVEKEDKHKKILKFEYQILKSLQGLPHVPILYDFIENTTGRLKFFSESSNCNFIVMELLGKNISNFKKSRDKFETQLACEILIQMLDAIEQLHDRGYIHRDIKPTNFVIKEKSKNNFQVFMVDYGLAKVHLDRYGRALTPRLNTDFRGTLTYASLNAHYKKELSRRDDLWSFFFMVLDLFSEVLPWRSCKDDKEEIKKVKEECLMYPEHPETILLLKSPCRLM